MERAAMVIRLHALLEDEARPGALITCGGGTEERWANNRPQSEKGHVVNFAVVCIEFARNQRIRLVCVANSKAPAALPRRPVFGVA